MYNSITIIGRVCADATVKTSSSKAKYVRFSVAVPREIASPDGTRITDFFNVLAFGAKADFVEKYFCKGSKILIQGRVQTDEYQNSEGRLVRGFTIIAEKISFVERKARSPSPSDKAGKSSAGRDCVPF